MIATNAYMVHVRCAHRDLSESLRRVHVALDCVSQSGKDDVVEEIESLRNKLSRHFAEEEMGGSLDEAVYRCPSLHRETMALIAQHVPILEYADDLANCAKHNPVNLASRFGELEHCVREHVDSENRVLAKAFGAWDNE